MYPASPIRSECGCKRPIWRWEGLTTPRLETLITGPDWDPHTEYWPSVTPEGDPRPVITWRTFDPAVMGGVRTAPRMAPFWLGDLRFSPSDPKAPPGWSSHLFPTNLYEFMATTFIFNAFQWSIWWCFLSHFWLGYSHQIDMSSRPSFIWKRPQVSILFPSHSPHFLKLLMTSERPIWITSSSAWATRSSYTWCIRWSSWWHHPRPTRNDSPHYFVTTQYYWQAAPCSELPQFLLQNQLNCTWLPVTFIA